MKNIFIGDVHGSYRGLKQLLNESNYQAQDRLWFVGDIVNRGDQSMDVLRFVADLGEKAKIVLGNHDVHLLGVYYGAREYGKKDTFYDVINHTDANIYMSWLKSRPFVEYCPDMSLAMVHAGVYPSWTLASTLFYSQSLSDKFIQTNNPKKTLIKLFGNSPRHWNENMKSSDVLRLSLNVFTRMRYLYKKPEKKRWDLEFDYKGTIAEAKKFETKEKQEIQPWFKQVNRDFKDVKVIFGHWSALGFYNHNNICCLDGGYLWGGKMISMIVRGDDISTAKFKAIAKS